MTRLTRYVGWTLFKSTVMALLLLLGLDWFFSFVQEAKNIGTGEYTLLTALLVLSLQIPQRIYMWFPMAVLLGSMMGLGALASSAEVVAMRAVGLSYQQLLWIAGRVMLVLSIVVLLMGEFVAPAAEQWGQTQRAFALSGGQTLMTDRGMWLRDNQDFIHVRKIHNDGRLDGVTRYRFNDGWHLSEALVAEYAEQVSDGWTLHHVQKSQFEEARVKIKTYDTLSWPSVLNLDILKAVSVKDLDALSVQDLWTNIRYRTHNGLDTQQFSLAFWQKVVQPVVILVMIFVGATTIFGPLRQANFGLRMLIGILLGLSFHFINEIFAPLALLYGVPAWISALLPAAFFLTLTGWFFKRLY